MEIEAGGVEGPVVVVAISGLKVTRAVELGRVPKPASKVRKQRKVWPQLRYLTSKDWILIDWPEGIVEIVISSFYSPRSSVDA